MTRTDEIISEFERRGSKLPQWAYRNMRDLIKENRQLTTASNRLWKRNEDLVDALMMYSTGLADGPDIAIQALQPNETTSRKDCPDCEGDGYIGNGKVKCETCEGTGKVSKTTTR